jgi:hypothetical protein
MANFPFLPGIPPLQNKIIAGGALLAATGIQRLLDKLKPTWGIYDTGGKIKVIEPDNFLGIDYVNSQNISDYPIEKGGFASYNKVQNPFTATIRMSKGGSERERTAFLSKLESLLISLDLYTIVTPERAYKNVSIENIDYRRESTNGVSLIVAALRFVEIREAILVSEQRAGAPSTTATTPTAQAPVGNGQVTAK